MSKPRPLRLARLIADLTSGINQQPPSRELGVETDHILIGHFLLRAEAAQRAGIPTEELIRRPDLLHIGGTWLEEVYFEFQFDESGIRSDLGAVVQTLRRSFDDLAIAEWLARPNEELAGATPLRKLSSGGSTEQLARAAESVGRA